jgi:ABC-type oligopeptide transport system substrate-binding subunit
MGDAQFNADTDERLSDYLKVDELIVTRICGVAPLRHEGRHWLIKSNIVGMSENLTGQDNAMAGDWAAEYWGLSE